MEPMVLSSRSAPTTPWKQLVCTGKAAPMRRFDKALCPGEVGTQWQHLHLCRVFAQTPEAHREMVLVLEDTQNDNVRV